LLSKALQVSPLQASRNCSGVVGVPAKQPPAPPVPVPPVPLLLLVEVLLDVLPAPPAPLLLLALPEELELEPTGWGLPVVSVPESLPQAT
jgi:hypothetical protein